MKMTFTISDDIYIVIGSIDHWSLTVFGYEFSIENYSNSNDLIVDIRRHSCFMSNSEVQQIVDYYRVFNAH